MSVTLVTAGLCGLIFFILSLQVSLVRRAQKVSLGDGGNDLLLSRIRAHANFAEYVPLALILIGVIETEAGESIGLSAAGTLLILSRVAHAIGMHSRSGPFRAAGTIGTYIVLVGTSIWAIVVAFS